MQQETVEGCKSRYQGVFSNQVSSLPSDNRGKDSGSLGSAIGAIGRSIGCCVAGLFCLRQGWAHFIHNLSIMLSTL